MKKQKKNNGLVEFVIPFGNPFEANPKDGLYDDCPHCQRMRKDIEAGCESGEGEIKIDPSVEETVH